MDTGTALITGAGIVRWRSSSFYLDDLVAPVLRSGACSGRDASECSSIRVESILVLGLSLLSSNKLLVVEGAIHKVDVGFGTNIFLHPGVSILVGQP